MKFPKSSNARLRQRNSQQHEQRENIPPGNLQSKSISVSRRCEDSIQIQLPQNKKKQENVYQQEIINFLVNKNEGVFEETNYFRHQPDITEHMRLVLLNWLIDVHLKYKLQPETLFITVHIIDSYLERKVLYRTQLQLLGITALWIAAKYQETYQVPKISNLVFICDSTYRKEQILQMESKIIESLNFEILTTSSLNFFNCLNQIVQFKEKDYFLSLYLLEICLFDISFRKYSSKTIACSIIFFIKKLRKREVCWDQELIAMFQINQSQLRPCARDICSMWQKSTEIDAISSLRSKFSSETYMEVGKIRITQSNRNANPQQR